MDLPPSKPFTIAEIESQIEKHQNREEKYERMLAHAQRQEEAETDLDKKTEWEIEVMRLSANLEMTKVRRKVREGDLEVRRAAREKKLSVEK